MWTIMDGGDDRIMNLKDYNIDLESKEILKIKSSFIQLLSVKKPEMEVLQCSMVEVVLDYLNIITLEDTDEMCVYNPLRGVWEFNGKPTIKTFIRKLSPKLTTYHLNEILDKVKTSDTYRKREILNPMNLLGVKNGVVNLDNQKFVSHSPDHYLTSCIDVTYDPGASCPAFVNFLTEVLEPKYVELYLEAMAYTLCPDYPIAAIFLLVGVGANGKSVALNVLTKFLGQDSVASVSLQSLGEYDFAAATLYGKRANIDDDLDKRAVKATGTFKRLTGNFQVTVPVKNKKPITFRNYAKFFYSMNTPPPIYGDDTHSVWRRMITFKFNRIFAEEEQDPYLLEKLTTEEEISGILNLLLAKLHDLLKRGYFDTPETTKQRRLKWKLMTDSVQIFCQEALTVELGEYITSANLYELYRDFCHELDIEVKSKGTLTKVIPMHIREVTSGRKTINKRQVRVWKNIIVKEGAVQEIKNQLPDDFKTHKTQKTDVQYCGSYLRAQGKVEVKENVSLLSNLSFLEKNNGDEVKHPKVRVIQTPLDLMYSMLYEAKGDPVLITEITEEGEKYKYKTDIMEKEINRELNQGKIFMPEEGKIQRND